MHDDAIQALGEEGARLLPHLRAVTWADGEALHQDGVVSARLDVIVRGEVEVRQAHVGGDIALGVRGPGSWLGEVGFVDGGPATATVVAKGPVEALCIDHAALSRLADEHPDVASLLLRRANRQMALRIWESSAGIIEEVGTGQYRVRKPDEVRSWAARALGWLLGTEKRP